MLNVLMTFPAASSGETILEFPNAAWGQDSLHNVIASLRLLAVEGEIQQHRDSGWVVIKHDPSLDQLVLEYKVKQDWRGALTTERDFRPIITPDYFHVYAHNLFMLPREQADMEDAGLDMTIDWTGFPEEYAFQNSFGAHQLQQEIKDISRDDFHSALFMGGDIRVHPIDINGNEVVLGLRGDWHVFQDTTLVAVLGQTMQVTIAIGLGDQAHWSVYSAF